MARSSPREHRRSSAASSRSPPPGVGRCVGSRDAPDGSLVNSDHTLEAVQAGDLIVNPWSGARPVELH